MRASGGSSQSDRNKDSNPFTHSSHGNPAFTPQKVTKGSNIVSKRHEEWLIPKKKIILNQILRIDLFVSRIV